MIRDCVEERSDYILDPVNIKSSTRDHYANCRHNAEFLFQRHHPATVEYRRGRDIELKLEFSQFAVGRDAGICYDRVTLAMLQGQVQQIPSMQTPGPKFLCTSRKQQWAKRKNVMVGWLWRCARDILIVASNLF